MTRVGAGVAPDSAVLPRLLAGDEPGLRAHFDRWGQVPQGGPEVITEVQRAGLLGRGGAGFPTARKLSAVAARQRTFVVANGTEREPVSSKDKVLLISSPHLVLDGLNLAAESVGATGAVLCVDRSAVRVLNSLERALSDRRRVGADTVPIRIEASPSPYVTGEESALVHWLNGGDAKPTFVPPRPFERGVRGRPTLVQNVETLAHLALIARFGADWFRGLGTAADPGSTLVTVSGEVERPGVFEVGLGSPLADVVGAAGPRGEVQAVLIGGYSGVWLAGDKAMRARLDSHSLSPLGASVGCGAIVVLGAQSCGLRETASVVGWLAGESAGQCGPCLHGLPAIAGALEALVAGDRKRGAERQLHQWLDVVAGRGACHHPDGVVKLVRSALSVFSSEVDAHRRKRCGVRRATLPTPARSEGWR